MSDDDPTPPADEAASDDPAAGDPPADETASGDSTSDDSATDASVPDSDIRVSEPPRVLVPVEVLEGETIPAPLVEFLAPASIVLLGYHVLPEQTPTEQASMQFEERARTAIDDIADAFRGVGRGVETRVAFTHDRDQTVERVATEVGATATLLPNPAGEIEDVLVPIRGAVDAGRLADLVATLVGGREATVTLWGLAGREFDADAAVARAREKLVDRGVPAEQVSTERSESDTPVWDIVDRSGEFDVIVMGAGGPSLWTTLFGETTERVAEGAVAPVLVVRERPD